MVVNYDAIALGKTLGQNIQAVDVQNQNAFDSESITSLNIIGINTIRVNSYFMMKTTQYAVDSFIIDSGIQGIIDSPYYKIDGGYDTTGYVLLRFYPQGLNHYENFMSTAFMAPASTCSIDTTNGRLIF